MNALAIGALIVAVTAAVTSIRTHRRLLRLEKRNREAAMGVAEAISSGLRGFRPTNERLDRGE